MTLLLNGEDREVEGCHTVAQLLAQLGLPPAAVLVEHNGLALRREEWEGRSLANDDRLEIIRIVAGG